MYLYRGSPLKGGGHGDASDHENLTVADFPDLTTSKINSTCVVPCRRGFCTLGLFIVVVGGR